MDFFIIVLKDISTRMLAKIRNLLSRSIQEHFSMLSFLQQQFLFLFVLFLERCLCSSLLWWQCLRFCSSLSMNWLVEVSTLLLMLETQYFFIYLLLSLDCLLAELYITKKLKVEIFFKYIFRFITKWNKFPYHYHKISKEFRLGFSNDIQVSGISFILTIIVYAFKRFLSTCFDALNFQYHGYQVHRNNHKFFSWRYVDICN